MLSLGAQQHRQHKTQNTKHKTQNTRHKTEKSIVLILRTPTTLYNSHGDAGYASDDVHKAHNTQLTAKIKNDSKDEGKIM
jgi:hypothetical protein